MKYTFLEHTADAKFQAFGKTLEEAFTHAAEAMFKVMVDPEQIKKLVTHDIFAEGADQKALLYNFLEELLVLMDAEQFLLHSVSDVSITEKDGLFSITATAIGDSGEKYESHGQVKAVTYNDMEITKEKDGYIVQVVVDT